MKKIHTLILLTLFSCLVSSSFAQNVLFTTPIDYIFYHNKFSPRINFSSQRNASFTCISNYLGLKKGIFSSYQNFISNEPVTSDSFNIILDSFLEYNENTSNTDTLSEGYLYKLTDTRAKSKNAFCFFDGKTLYLKNPHKRTFDKIHYLPATIIGRYPIIEVYYDLETGLCVIGDSIQNKSITKTQKLIVFINERGKLVEANNQTVISLIRKEEDLYREFNNEKNITADILKKYLVKMNERYPIQ